MDPRFFVRLDASADMPAAGMKVTLATVDARHARDVLRARPGEPCEVVVESLDDSQGRLFAGVFVEVGREVVVALGDELPPAAPDRTSVALVQALPVPRKVDEVVEKGTEVGIGHFVLVPAEGSPRVGAGRLSERVERWGRIAREAAKQSRQSSVPRVEAAASLEDAAVLLGAAGYASVVLTPGGAIHLGDLVTMWLAAGGRPAPATAGDAAAGAFGEIVRIALWVGPEGGWSVGELERLRGLGLQTAGLGRRILRTETAGPVAAAVARFAAGDR